jgi:spoIIIJ-associated protein
MPPVDTLTEAEILGTPRGRAGPAAPAAERESALDAEEPTRGEPDLGPAPAEVEQVRQTLQHMLELIGVDVAVSPGAPGRTGLQLDLTGADQKRLMEKDGELLSALQLVLNRMARRAWPGVGRIQLARDGERRRRDDELVDLARETARQVEQSGRTKKLHPMNAYERRLVHLTVREFRGLTSSSVGSGALKRVSIAKIQNSL